MGLNFFLSQDVSTVCSRTAFCLASGNNTTNSQSRLNDYIRITEAPFGLLLNS